MESVIERIGAVVALGALYVVLPVVAETYQRFRRRRAVRCPRDAEAAEIQVDAAHAAATAAFRNPDLRVAHCSRWPGAASCSRECVRPAA